MPEITILQLTEKQGVSADDALEIQDSSTPENLSRHIKASHLLNRANHTGDAPSSSLTTSRGKVLLGRYSPDFGVVQEITTGSGVKLTDAGELTAADPHFDDLPYDGGTYGLRNGVWNEAAIKDHTHSAESIGFEAPNDGKQYSRGNETWNDLSTPLSLKADTTITDALRTDMTDVQAKAAVNANNIVTLQSASVSQSTRIGTNELAISTLQTGKADVGHKHVAADINTATGNVLVGKPSVGSGSASEIPLGANLAIVDGKLTASVSSSGINVEDEGIQIATGASTLNFVGSAVTASVAGGKVNVSITGTGGGGGVTEAPLDHQTYARVDAAWQPIDPFLMAVNEATADISTLSAGLDDLSDVVVNHESRISAQESLDITQNGRITAVETLSQSQATRLDGHDVQISALQTGKADAVHNHASNQINLATTNRILGRVAAGTGAAEELRVGAGLTLDSNGLSAAITTAANVGTGNGQSYKGVSGSTQQFRTIAAGEGISILQDSNTITISINGGLAAVKTIHTGYFPTATNVQGTGEDQFYSDVVLPIPVSDIKKCHVDVQFSKYGQDAANVIMGTARLINISTLRISVQVPYGSRNSGRYYITEYN